MDIDSDIRGELTPEECQRLTRVKSSLHKYSEFQDALSQDEMNEKIQEEERRSQVNTSIIFLLFTALLLGYSLFQAFGLSSTCSSSRRSPAMLQTNQTLVFGENNCYWQIVFENPQKVCDYFSSLAESKCIVREA